MLSATPTSPFDSQGKNPSHLTSSEPRRVRHTPSLSLTRFIGSYSTSAMPAFSAAENAPANGCASIEDMEMLAATMAAFKTARTDVLKVGEVYSFV